jgi:hypothetical protein
MNEVECAMALHDSFPLFPKIIESCPCVIERKDLGVGGRNLHRLGPPENLMPNAIGKIEPQASGSRASLFGG